MDMENFEKDLVKLVNKHSLETFFANTPDFVLADVAVKALNSFRANVIARDRWYGFDAESRSKVQIASEKLLNKEPEE